MSRQLLDGHQIPQRISLPTYPFARERYWIPESTILDSADNRRGLHSVNSIPKLHPLVHQNVSTLTEQCFRTNFTGNEFFLRDHQVQGESVLPGVAYLEMARAATEMAVKDGRATQLKDVVWIRPLVVQDEPQDVQLGLYPEENGEIAFG
ncbi:polyketide synthase dehydratase domain-containing protein [Chloroflexi bacterium TSY]|nr:polyketide synthase dehydratase domain-containing protein [Chloroflexi bacterium TSY]